MNRILVASDGSGSGDRAVSLAVKLAVRLDADLTILSVIERVTDIDIAGFAEAEGTTSGAAVEDLCDAILHRAGEEAAKEVGTGRVRKKRAAGNPALVILQEISELRPDLVVIGKRGRGRLSGLLLGSVSQKLVSLAPCAVVVVP